MIQQLVKKNILGIDITDASESEILEYVFSFLESNKDSLSIMTPNPEMVMYARRHKSFQDILNRAGLSLCDGIGLYKAALLLGSTVKERISGVDFMEKLCSESAKKGVTVGFLGGKEGIAEKTAECLIKKYPSLKVAFVGEEWSEDGFTSASHVASSMQHGEKDEKKHTTSYLLRTTKQVDILFVAFGFPKQERWIDEHLGNLPIRVMMGVGGAFDYLSGSVSRAPKLLRSFGLEWLYRLVRQPWRVKRQLALPQFMLLVLRERFKH